MWFPLVHVHVVHGCPEIVRAANSICSERVSKGPYVGGGAAVALLVI